MRHESIQSIIMTSEANFLHALRAIAIHPAARGLEDDAAVLSVASLGNVHKNLVLTHDMMAEGVHWLPDADPADVAWKILSSNLSDLAAKGASPVGVLLGYSLASDDHWNTAFLAGLKSALAHYSVPLLGGDTISAEGARTIAMTALGQSRMAPSRSGAQAGDGLYLTGAVGLAGLGLRLLKGESAQNMGLSPEEERLAIAQHQRPVPRLRDGQRLAPLVHAMMDISDGLLIDAQRMAAASKLSAVIDIETVPHAGDIMAAMTAGDDYELLFAAPRSSVLPVPATCIGHFERGSGLTLRRDGQPVALPDHLGWLHNS